MGLSRFELKRLSCPGLPGPISWSSHVTVVSEPYGLVSEVSMHLCGRIQWNIRWLQVSGREEDRNHIQVGFFFILVAVLLKLETITQFYISPVTVTTLADREMVHLKAPGYGSRRNSSSRARNVVSHACSGVAGENADIFFSSFLWSGKTCIKYKY